jgi:hypothetical protein
MRVKQVPIVVSGGLDTKTNPKLVRPGAALQIDNMYQQRPGEWRVRNGMTTQASTGYSVASAPLLYQSPSGTGVSAVTRGLANAAGTTAYAVPARFGPLGAGSGWESASGSAGLRFPYPAYTARTDALFSDLAADLFDGDLAAIGSLTSVTTKTSNQVKFFDRTTGRAEDYTGIIGTPPITPPRASATTAYLVSVSLSGAGPYSINIVTFSTAGVWASYVPASLAGVVAAAQPWFDVVQNPGTDVVSIAYRDTAGGVSVASVNASTGVVTIGPTNFPAIDASMCLGWMNWVDNSTALVTLATAGTVNGVRWYRFTTAALANTGSLTIDGTAVANVRQITGHWDAIAGTSVVLWEVTSATSRLYDKVLRGLGSGGTLTLAPSFALYSRTAKGADGRWYFVGAYDSTVQGSYTLLTVDDFVNAHGQNRSAPMCIAMAGEGGGRRAAQSSVTNVIASGSTFMAALPRNKRVTIAGVSSQQGRVMQLATFSDMASTGSRARELGGVTYVPGGLVYADDGQSCRPAVVPRYPEAPTLTPGNFGATPPWNMTPSKTYGYRLVIKRRDASGRIMRSAASVPVTVTLGPGDNGVTITYPNPYLAWDDYAALDSMEFYRVGPIEDGKTLYNLVSTQALSGNTDTFSTADPTSDAVAATGEVAYFTGNVEENIAPPSCSLLEVNGGRVWTVNAEDPTELRYSKQSKAGTIPGFTPDFTLRIDGDGKGGITALGSMDGLLYVFKDGAIWAVGGEGPNDTGAGSFSPPQIVSRETGVPAGLARSVVSTPDGLMFQSTRGIYLLDRGRGLTYIGSPVEAYTIANSVVDASTVRGTTQARFLMASGRCLVWDYQVKQWSTFILPVGGSTVTGCVDTAAGWYVVTADGKLRLEVAGATTDDGTAIVPVISLPHLNFAGLSGYQRLYSLDILLDVVGNHVISVDAEYNYSGALTGSPKTKGLTTANPTAQVQYLPPDGAAKCTAMRPVITVNGNPVNGTFRLTGVTATVGIKSGTNISDGQRLT